jgi:archaeal flagellin FlaB
MRARTRWIRDRRGDMGVGSLVLFVTSVLVVATVSSLLISTANKVHAQAENTGEWVITNVASGFIFRDITGEVQANQSSIKTIFVQVQLQAGSPAVNMDLVTVQYVCGMNKQVMKMGSPVNSTDPGTPNCKNYTARQIVANPLGGPTWSNGNHILQQGDMILIAISNDAGSLDLGHTQPVTLKFMPAYGAPTTVNFVTPPCYSAGYVNLK